MSRRIQRCSTARSPTTSGSARPQATDADVRRAAELAHAAEFIEALPAGYRDARGRARHQALGRAAPACRDCARDPEGRADPDPRRGDELARLRERGAHPGCALDADGASHGHRDRTPSVDGPTHGLARRPRARAVVEQGSHEALLARGGIYASLWTHQSGGFLPTSDIDGVQDSAGAQRRLDCATSQVRARPVVPMNHRRLVH